MFLQVVRFVFRIVLRIIARVTIEGYGNVPETGGAIVVTNHIGRLDALLGVILADRDDFILMIAEKYQKNAFWRWTAKEVDAVWLDRYEADIHALRIVYKRLKKGEILGMAPEGTRSKSEALAYGKQGAAYLAGKTGLPVIPVGLAGTEDRVVKERLRRLRRLDIEIRIGQPFYLPPMDRKDREAYLERNTDEIMCRIAALLPSSYRGVYADHPRLQELLAEQAPVTARAGYT
jgi:1-acyl-sn-glycerol-3-phosphate acyltransferase